MQNTRLKPKWLVIAALTLISVLSVALFTGCAPGESPSEAPATTAEVSTVPEAPLTNTNSVIEGAVATAADIDKYCLNCHLDSDLPNWNKNTIDAAMVESMNPVLSDNDRDALAAYFATIEPQEQEQH
jgi:hypothetical protein